MLPQLAFGAVAAVCALLRPLRGETRRRETPHCRSNVADVRPRQCRLSSAAACTQRSWKSIVERLRVVRKSRCGNVGFVGPLRPSQLFIRCDLIVFHDWHVV